MSCGNNIYKSIYTNNSSCSTSTCPTNRCPDFVLKRHNTRPAFKVNIGTCDGPMDLTDETLVLEASIWTTAKLKTTIDGDIEYIDLADNIGFNQVLNGDIIMMSHVRSPEYMLVTGFDEANHLIHVQRGYHASEARTWKKGVLLRIFRRMSAEASIETTLIDEIQEDGSTLTNQVSETYLVYNFLPQDTCTPGCYWLEFKLLKMLTENENYEEDIDVLSIDVSTISFTSSDLSYTDFKCALGAGVEWERRFPDESEGFLISIIDSPTAEI